MSELKLDSEGLEVLVLKSIVDSVTPKQREKFIESAVAQLLVPRETGYGYNSPKKTPLQQALETAVNDVVFQAAKTMVRDNEELKAKIYAMIAEAIETILAGDHDQRIFREVSSSLAQALLKRED